MALSRDQILEADDSTAQEVDVPEWGGTVRVASMTGAARDAWENALVKREGGKITPNLDDVRARLVAATVVDDAGTLLFSAADVRRLSLKSAKALDRVCKVAQRLNGLTAEDLEDAKGN
jgi:hypothetical protein